MGAAYGKLWVVIEEKRLRWVNERQRDVKCLESEVVVGLVNAK